MNELEYYIFVLGRDLLAKELEKVENDIAYDACLEIAKLFLNSIEYTNYNFSGYDSLVNFIHNNYDVITSIICDVKE